MSWPLKYDPASQSIPFGGRDRTLYPNNLALFDQTALVAGDVSRTSFRGERFEDGNTVDTGSEEDRCANVTSLNRTSPIPYTKINQLEESRQKQKRFVKSLARGKWNRYTRQYSSRTFYEAQNSTNGLVTNHHTSTAPNFPTNVPYIALSEARRITLNNQAARARAYNDQTSEGSEWSFDSFLVDPAAIILTTAKGLLTIKTYLSMTDARSSTPPETYYSPQPSIKGKRTLIIAHPPVPKGQSLYTHRNKKLNRSLTAQNFFPTLALSHHHHHQASPRIRH